MTGNVDQILNMTNYQKIVKNIFFGRLLANVILNFFLIPTYGIEGGNRKFNNKHSSKPCFVIIIKKKLGFNFYVDLRFITIKSMFPELSVVVINFMVNPI
jgi:O-antigen/teichoic acid export membrane protein